MIEGNYVDVVWVKLDVRSVGYVKGVVKSRVYVLVPVMAHVPLVMSILEVSAIYVPSAVIVRAMGLHVLHVEILIAVQTEESLVAVVEVTRGADDAGCAKNVVTPMIALVLFLIHLSHRKQHYRHHQLKTIHMTFKITIA